CPENEHGGGETEGEPALRHDEPPAGREFAAQIITRLVAGMFRSGGAAFRDEEGEHMPAAKAKTYREQTFDHLKGLDGISDAQIEEHLKLYAGYVKQVNGLNAELAELRGRGQASGTSPEFAELTRRLGFEYNGMILHEYYFANLKRAAEPMPPAGSGLAQALGQAFGSMEQWLKD